MFENSAIRTRVLLGVESVGSKNYQHINHPESTLLGVLDSTNTTFGLVVTHLCFFGIIYQGRNSLFYCILDSQARIRCCLNIFPEMFSNRASGNQAFTCTLILLLEELQELISFVSTDGILHCS